MRMSRRVGAGLGGCGCSSAVMESTALFDMEY